MEYRCQKSLDVIVIIICALVSGLISPSVDCSELLLRNQSNYSQRQEEDGRSECRFLIKVALIFAN